MQKKIQDEVARCEAAVEQEMIREMGYYAYNDLQNSIERRNLNLLEKELEKYDPHTASLVKDYYHDHSLSNQSECEGGEISIIMHDGWHGYDLPEFIHKNPLYDDKDPFRTCGDKPQWRNRRRAARKFNVSLSRGSDDATLVIEKMREEELATHRVVWADFY